MRRLSVLVILFVVAVSYGCASMLPKEKKTSDLHWKSFKEVETAYNMVEPGKTTRAHLRALAFDPERTSGGKELGYFETRNLIIPPGQNVDVSKLPAGLRECYEAGELCVAQVYPTIEQTRAEQEGNFLANKTDYNVKTRHTGWKFYPKFFLKLVKPQAASDDDVVVYKDRDKDPNINYVQEKEDKWGPVKTILGPVKGFLSIFGVP